MRNLIPIAIAAIAAMVVLPDAASAQGRRRGRGGEPGRAESAKVGKMAPDFTLKHLEIDKKKKSDEAKKETKESEDAKTTEKKKDKKSVKLSSFRGKKPVVLLFGSYT